MKFLLVLLVIVVILTLRAAAVRSSQRRHAADRREADPYSTVPVGRRDAAERARSKQPGRSLQDIQPRRPRRFTGRPPRR